jgi:hypothetical protein
VLTKELDFDDADLAAVDARVIEEIDIATDAAEASPMPEPTDALVGIYADPARIEPLWYRAGIRSAVAAHERAAGWGAFNG